MKISQKMISKLYEAIYAPIIDARIALKLSPKDDVILAQVMNKIWDKQKEALKLPKYY